MTLVRRIPDDGLGYPRHMEPSEQQPVRTTRRVMTVTIGGILVVLAIMLVIAWLLGDPTNNLGEHQPEPSPAETSGS